MTAVPTEPPLFGCYYCGEGHETSECPDRETPLQAAEQVNAMWRKWHGKIAGMLGIDSTKHHLTIKAVADLAAENKRLREANAKLVEACKHGHGLTSLLLNAATMLDNVAKISSVPHGEALAGFAKRLRHKEQLESAAIEESIAAEKEPAQ